MGLAVLADHPVVAEVLWPLLALTIDLRHEQQRTAPTLQPCTIALNRGPNLRALIPSAIRATITTFRTGPNILLYMSLERPFTFSSTLDENVPFRRT